MKSVFFQGPRWKSSGLPSVLGPGAQGCPVYSDNGSAWGRWTRSCGGLKPDLPSSSQCTAFSSWKRPSEPHTPLSTTPHLSDAGLPAVHRRALGPTDTGQKGLGGASAPIRLSDGGLFSLEWAGDFDFGGEGCSSNKAEPRGLIFTQHLRGLSGEHICRYPLPALLKYRFQGPV